MSNPQQMYTESEAMHIAAKEVAKQRMGDIERRITENDTKSSVALVEIKSQITQVIYMIEKQNVEQEKSQKEFKAEIEKEFASKIDMQRLESKLDQLWMKITFTIAGVTAVGVFVAWALGIVNNYKHLVG